MYESIRSCCEMFASKSCRVHVSPATVSPATCPSPLDELDHDVADAIQCVANRVSAALDDDAPRSPGRTKITKKRARRKHTGPGVARSTAAAVLPRSGLRVQARLRVVDYRDRGSHQAGE